LQRGLALLICLAGLKPAQVEHALVGKICSNRKSDDKNEQEEEG
jgi:hypothetical protein